MSEELLSPGEAVKFLGVSRERLKQLREKGAIQAVRMGNFWFYPRASLERQKQRAEQYRGKGSAGTLIPA